MICTSLSARITHKECKLLKIYLLVNWLILRGGGDIDDHVSKMGKHLESNPEKCGDVIGGFLHKGVMIMNARIQRYASFASYI